MRFLRRLARLLVALLLVVLLPVLVWWIYNRIDEVPSEEALQLAEPFQRTLADADNAWLHMLGMDAPEDMEPRALGRMRLDAYEAWVHAPPPRSRRDARVESLFTPVLQVQRPDPAMFGVDHWCPIHTVDCIDWVWSKGQMLFQLTSSNLPLLHRYLALFDMPHLEELATPTVDSPTIDFEIAEFHRNLLAQEMISPNLGPPAVANLAAAASFWRRLGAQARSLQLRLDASHQLEMSRRLFDQAMNREWFDLAAFPDGTLAALLDPPASAERDWTTQARHEFQRFDNSLRGEAIGSLKAAWQRCRRNGGDDCMTTWLMGQAYAHQATLNMRARIDLWMLDALHAEPADVESVFARGGALMDDISPLPEGMRAQLGAMAYNLTGRTLAAISIPALTFVKREHDREAFRRMLVIKVEARRQGLAHADVPAFLESRPASLRDPYTGEAFGWDFVRGETFYRRSAPGSAGAFLRIRPLVVPARPAHVEICERPWRVALALARAGDGPGGVDFDHPVTFVTCAYDQAAAAWVEQDAAAVDIEPFWDVASAPARTETDVSGEDGEEYLPVSVYFGAAAAQRLSVFAAFRSHGSWVQIEDSDEMINTIVLDPPARPFVALRLESTSPRDIGDALREALRNSRGMLVDGTDLLTTRIILSMQRDMPVEAALRYLVERHNAVESAQLALHAVEGGGYALMVAEPAR